MRHLLEVRRLHTPLLHVFLSGCPKAGCEVFIFSTERHVSVNAAGVRQLAQGVALQRPEQKAVAVDTPVPGDTIHMCKDQKLWLESALQHQSYCAITSAEKMPPL